MHVAINRKKPTTYEHARRLPQINSYVDGTGERLRK